MARKFIELQELAALLGISTDDISDMRSRGEAHGYRDGSTWKFKIEEVQRLASDRGITLSEAALAGEVPLAGDSEFLSRVDEELDVLSDVGGDFVDPGESILITDEDFGSGLGNKTPSTVIGGKNSTPSNDSNRSDDTGGKEDDAADGSDVLSGSTGGSGQGSLSENLAENSSRVEGMSDELQLEVTSSGDLGAGESLSLEESDVELANSSAGSASIDLDFDEEDDDLVLGGGSDVTLASEDSGVSLSSPSDTGLSLSDQSFELDGSGAESALELPEALISSDAPDGDSDFLLTPVEELSDEDSDSGSQVIAIDDDSFASDVDLGGVGVDNDVFSAEPTAVSPGVQVERLNEGSESSYTLINVLTLATAVLVLSFTGFCMYDIVRHMWSWDEPYAINSSMMDWILGILGG